MIEAAKNAVTVIVRWPHAYKFEREHRKAPIPGLAVLDAEGNYVGGVALPSEDAIAKVVELLGK